MLKHIFLLSLFCLCFLGQIFATENNISIEKWIKASECAPPKNEIVLIATFTKNSDSTLNIGFLGFGYRVNNQWCIDKKYYLFGDTYWYQIQFPRSLDEEVMVY